MTITKKLILILIIFTHYIDILYSRELTITIPEQFGQEVLPLPPFPSESINQLVIQPYDIEVFDSKNYLPLIPQTIITYNYYPNFLNNYIPVKGLFTHTYGVDTDFDSGKILYSGEYSNNSFDLIVDGAFDTSSFEPHGGILYREYRLPIIVEAVGALNEHKLSLEVLDMGYRLNWSVKTLFSDDGFKYNSKFEYNGLFYPILDLSYSKELAFYGILGGGTKFLKMGVGTLNSKPIYPYIYLDKIWENYILGVQTIANPDNIDYRSQIGYKSRNYLKLGLGAKIYEDYNQIAPYISLCEDYIWGEREYIISPDDIMINFIFINASFTSIITLKRSTNNFSVNILFKYKVGQK